MIRGGAAPIQAGTASCMPEQGRRHSCLKTKNRSLALHGDLAAASTEIGKRDRGFLQIHAD